MKYFKALTLITFLSLTPLKAHANTLPTFPWPLQQIFLAMISFGHWSDAKEKEVEEWYYRVPSPIREGVFEED